MKILLCPDKFKGSISAQDVCAALMRGMLQHNENLLIQSMPLADGGDGSIEILSRYIEMEAVTVETVDPLMRPLRAEYYRSGDTAYIELASAAGIALLKEADRNPLHTSTLGTGLMMRDALAKGAKHIKLFIGGSSTNDGGVGIAHGLGYRLMDAAGKELRPVGGELGSICQIDASAALDLTDVSIEIMCDVDNPMYGPRGAAYTYGPQKGASPAEVALLDAGLRRWAAVLADAGAADLGERQGMGAAGAVSAAVVGLCGASMRPGFELMAEVLQVREAIAEADLVITGEGKVDATSFSGKVVGNVARLCHEYNVACGLVAGVIDLYEEGASRYQLRYDLLTRADSPEAAMNNAAEYLEAIGRDIAADLED